MYSGDRTETVTNDQTTWRLGVVITNKTTIRDADAYHGMVIGFGPTAGNTDGLAEKPPVGDPFGDVNLSRPTPPQHDRLLVKLGPDDVTFTARIQAEAGSPDCNQAPGVDFGPATPLTTLLPSNGSGPVSPDWSHLVLYRKHSDN